MFTQSPKNDFPIFTNQPSLVYLDSAATTQKPQTVITRTTDYYTNYCANIARGLYNLSEEATTAYEHSRMVIADFINASSDEIIFTRGTTESINLLSYSLESSIEPGDEILVSISEHHSNFLPWQALAKRRQANLKIIPVNKEGFLESSVVASYITPQTKIFSLTYISNVLGVIQPIQELIAQAKSLQPTIITVVDAAQAVAHIPLDVRTLNCDFLAFSGHKMFGPTGVGVLYGKKVLLDALPPFHYGGEMVLEARSDTSLFKEAPYKFEAGTPNIAGVTALQDAVRYILDLGFASIRQHEENVLSYALQSLNAEFGDAINIFGSQNTAYKSGVIAFSLKGIHPHDIAQLLAEHSICIRSGQHCAAPLHDALQLPATARISISVYTTKQDIDALVAALRNIYNTFQVTETPSITRSVN